MVFPGQNTVVVDVETIIPFWNRIWKHKWSSDMIAFKYKGDIIMVHHRYVSVVDVP